MPTNNPTPEPVYGCCKREVSRGHVNSCELRYGTMHARETGEGETRRVSCCGRLVRDLARGDLSTTDPEAVTCVGLNPPLPDDAVWSLANTPPDGSTPPWVWTDEDGESAMMRGHADPSLLIGVLAMETGETNYELEDVRHVWATFHTHYDGCRDGLAPDEGCQCGGETTWWATLCEESTPGALPVTRWAV